VTSKCSSCVFQTLQPTDRDKAVSDFSADNNALILEKFGFEIFGKDIRSLRAEKWLCDSILNFYFSLLVARSHSTDSLPKVYAYETFFLACLKRTD